jgi:periplasmic divalent cation tolerance protein
METALVVLTTIGDADAAARLGRALVDERLAACVNIVGPLRSIYRWQGEIADQAEVLCLIKTTPETWPRLRARVVELHPYQVPEIIALPLTDLHAPYLDWLRAQVS